MKLWGKKLDVKNITVVPLSRHRLRFQASITDEGQCDRAVGRVEQKKFPVLEAWSWAKNGDHDGICLTLVVSDVPLLDFAEVAEKFEKMVSG